MPFFTRANSRSVTPRSATSAIAFAISASSSRGWTPGFAVAVSMIMPSSLLELLPMLTSCAICFSYTSVRYRRELLPPAMMSVSASRAASSGLNAGTLCHT